MPPRKPKVFFAIPCGEFYSVQNGIIRQVAESAGVEADIVEEDVLSRELWGKICERIRSADYFVADITSQSFNIAIELGYALKEKPEHRVGIFISKAVSVPSDLQGFVRQEYSSFGSFRKVLIEWLRQVVPNLGKLPPDPSASERGVLFLEEFMDRDSFLKRWTIPPYGSAIPTHEGLRFTSGTLPILTTNLAILGDCECEFQARIEHERLGWVFKGTMASNRFYPAFCVMLQFDKKGELTPHIWSEKHRWKIFKTTRVSLRVSNEGWFTLRCQIRGDGVRVKQKDRLLFEADFAKAPYSEFYSDTPIKEGQIGFRCCDPGEEATIRYVKVREV